MNNMVFVGSTPVQDLLPGYREPADCDIWYCGKKPEVYWTNQRVEFKEMPADIVEYVLFNNNSLDTFYTIKLSHAHWDIKWEKTVADLARFKAAGAKCDETLYDMLFPYWEQFHGDKRQLSLKKTKDQFFTNAVRCPIDHDYLHELVAHYDKPIYQTVLKDNEEVWVDKDKFMALSERDRLLMIREEVYVIALERWYIPMEGKIPTVVAYRRALKLVATRLTKGWFCKYLLDNYAELCHIEKGHNFVKIFNERNKADDRYSANYQRITKREDPRRTA